MSTIAAFEVRQLKQCYDGEFTLAVDDLTIDLGDVFCLLGPTGAGKSTLLRLLCGVETSSAGNVHIEDRPAASRAAARRITMVFQRPLLLNGTVRFNVEYGLRLRGRRSDCAARVDPLLKRLRLARIAAQSAHSLSGGQTQLVALARALVLQPDVLLLDEPTANLDPAHVALVEEVIAEYQSQRNMTIVWATHNLFQARRVGTRIGLLLNGQMVEVAPTETFFRTPADRRTADFVAGKMIY